MSALDDWRPIDDLYRELTGLLSSAERARAAISEAIEQTKLRTARYPAYGPGVRANQIAECTPEWWRGRKLKLLGELLVWTEPDGATMECEWMIVVCPEDAVVLWPSIATPDAPPVTPSKTLSPKQQLVSDALDKLAKEGMSVDALPIRQQLNFVNERIGKLSPGNTTSERTLRDVKKARKG